jgi:hypothetical protein
VDADAIANRFVHHPPKNEDVVEAHVSAREEFMHLALQINALFPDCPEKEKAIDALDLAAMHTNAGIARTQLETQSLTG